MIKGMLPNLNLGKLLEKKKELPTGMCEVHIKGSEDFVLKMFGLL